MFTAQQAKDAIEGMEKTSPNDWWPLLKTLVIDLYEGVETLNTEHAKTLRGAKNTYAQLKQMREFFEQLKARLSGKSTDPAPSTAAPTVDSNGAVGADGTALTPEQAALERQMDEALGAAPARGVGAPTGNVATSASGEPLTREQASLEAQMDEAIRANNGA